MAVTRQLIRGSASAPSLAMAISSVEAIDASTKTVCSSLRPFSTISFRRSAVAEEYRGSARPRTPDLKPPLKNPGSYFLNNAAIFSSVSFSDTGVSGQKTEQRRFGRKIWWNGGDWGRGMDCERAPLTVQLEPLCFIDFNAFANQEKTMSS